MNEHDRILIDQGIQHGKPVIKGTRVPVVRLVAEVAGGASLEDAAREYQVSVEDAKAALSFATDLKPTE